MSVFISNELILFIWIVTMARLIFVSDCSEVIRLDPVPLKKIAGSGKQVTLLCSVSEGDDVTFSWLKNNAIVYSGQGMQISTDETSSKVTLKKVSSSDSGVFTCVARNDVSTDRITVELIVEGWFILRPLILA